MVGLHYGGITLWCDYITAERRRGLQRDFLLPATRPYTKPVSAYNFPGDNAQGYLTNVHVGLPKSGGRNCQGHDVSTSRSLYVKAKVTVMIVKVKQWQSQGHDLSRSRSCSVKVQAMICQGQGKD